MDLYLEFSLLVVTSGTWTQDWTGQNTLRRLSKTASDMTYSDLFLPEKWTIEAWI